VLGIDARHRSYPTGIGGDPMTILLALLLQAQVHVQVSLPTVRFEVTPPLVEIQPGVMVVHDYGDEVFFTGGWYWVRWTDGRWYRARDHRGGWVVAAPAVVPPVLVGVPAGRYKHHKAKPEKWRTVSADGTVTEYKVKEKHGMTEVKVKEKKGKQKKGKWK
jgi:hypothetical protein